VFFASLEKEKAHLILLGTGVVCERRAVTVQRISFSLGKRGNGYKTHIGDSRDRGV
jgi:hypothetical protein